MRQFIIYAKNLITSVRDGPKESRAEIEKAYLAMQMNLVPSSNTGSEQKNK
jgi:hypothetical protein